MSNFHHTAEGDSIRIEEGRFLHCRIAREDGEYVDAHMDLNCCIGNDNGRFQWGGQSKSHPAIKLVSSMSQLTLSLDFSETAEDIRFDLEGGGEPILRARLQNMDGDYQDCDLNLTERIMNRDGQLCFGK